MKNDLIYVFCVTDTPPFPGQSIESHGLNSFTISNFYIVYKAVPESEFSEVNLKRNLSDIHWLETMAIEHINVINKIMLYSTVIPFKFGTIFNTEESLSKFFTDYADSIEENFLQIKGKEEWSVKIYCDRRKLGEMIDEVSKDAAALEEQIMSSSPGKAYLLKRKKTEFVGLEMDRITKDHGQSYFDDFKNLSESSRLNNIQPSEVTGRGDTMILNAAFLVNKDNVTFFKVTANNLRKKDGDTGFLIETTGPWPPFSFVAIKEKTHA
jgi:hypothetical protein